MGYKMKHTNGKKADTSAFPFKSESPVKLGFMEGAGRIIKGGAMMGPMGAIGAATTLSSMDDEKKYEDVLAAEGLERGFFGKLGFGGGKSKQREARIAELKEQDQMGIDRERIESRGGATAGPA
mgnify:CR=1 FL=1